MFRNLSDFKSWLATSEFVVEILQSRSNQLHNSNDQRSKSKRAGVVPMIEQVRSYNAGAKEVQLWYLKQFLVIMKIWY